MPRDVACWREMASAGTNEQIVDAVLEDLDLESSGLLVDLPEDLTTRVFLRLSHMAEMLLWELDMTDEERGVLRKETFRLTQVTLGERGRPREAVALYAMQHDFIYPHRDEWQRTLAFLVRVELYRQLEEMVPRKAFAARSIDYLNNTRLLGSMSDFPNAEAEAIELRVYLQEQLGFSYRELGDHLSAADAFQRAAGMTGNPEAEVESITSAAAALADAGQRQEAFRLLETVEPRLAEASDPEIVEGWQFHRERLRAELGGQRLRPERQVKGRFDDVGRIFDQWLRREQVPDDDSVARLAEIMRGLGGDADPDKEENAVWGFKVLLNEMAMTPADRRPVRFLELMAQAEKLEALVDDQDLKIQRRILLARQRMAFGATDSALELFAGLWPRVRAAWADDQRLGVAGFYLQALVVHGPAGQDDLVFGLIDQLTSSLERELNRQPGPGARDWVRTFAQRPLECALWALLLSAESHGSDSDSGQALLARAWDLIMLARNPELQHGGAQPARGGETAELEARFHRALRRDLASRGRAGDDAIGHLEALLELEISTLRSSRGARRAPGLPGGGTAIAFFQIRETLSDKPLIVLCHAESRFSGAMIDDAHAGIAVALRKWRRHLALGLAAEHTDTREVRDAARELFRLAEAAAPEATWHLYPDRPLYDLPLEVLPDPSGAGASLGERKALQWMLRNSTDSSAGDRVALSRGWLGLGGVPAMGKKFGDLPETRIEIRRIEANLKSAKRPVTHLLRKQATARNLRRRIASMKPAVIHLACHGSSHPTHPECCALILAPAPGAPDSELLPFREIRRLDLHGVDLVVLSACASLIGSSDRSAGMKGMTWAFLEAGAGRVLASRYRVKDAATAALMARLYPNLLRHPLTEALRLTRAECLEAGMDRYQLGAWTLWG